MSEFISRPKVGLGILVLREAEVLLGKRIGAFGSGLYALPGGHLEQGESFEACALRELGEEVGIEVSGLRPLCVINHFDPSERDQHYVEIGMVADWANGEPQNLEPHKLESWGWYQINNLPDGVFSTVNNYFIALSRYQAIFDLEG